MVTAATFQHWFEIQAAGLLDRLVLAMVSMLNQHRSNFTVDLHRADVTNQHILDDESAEKVMRGLNMNDRSLLCLPLFAFASTRRVRPNPNGPKGCRRVSYATFERMLFKLGVPFVRVDEAKKAIFAGGAIESFHFLVYRTEGPNFMVHLGPRNLKTVEGMREWEQTFGADFLAVYARMNPAGDVRYVGLDGLDVAVELAVHWPVGDVVRPT